MILNKFFNHYQSFSFTNHFPKVFKSLQLFQSHNRYRASPVPCSNCSGVKMKLKKKKIYFYFYNYLSRSTVVATCLPLIGWWFTFYYKILDYFQHNTMTNDVLCLGKFWTECENLLFFNIKDDNLSCWYKVGGK